MHVRRLTPDHAADYRAIMIEGYACAPGAFTATVAEREPQPMSFWEARVSADPSSPERVYGAFVDGTLAGVAGLEFLERPRTRHKAWLFGMYVRPGHRGSGIARALVEAVVDGARSRDGVILVQLTVSDGNAAAIRLYESCGFRAFGTEPMALRVGDRFVGKVHMWRLLEETAAAAGG